DGARAGGGASAATWIRGVAETPERKGDGANELIKGPTAETQRTQSLRRGCDELCAASAWLCVCAVGAEEASSARTLVFDRQVNVMRKRFIVPVIILILLSLPLAGCVQTPSTDESAGTGESKKSGDEKAPGAQAGTAQAAAPQPTDAPRYSGP